MKRRAPGLLAILFLLHGCAPTRPRTLSVGPSPPVAPIQQFVDVTREAGLRFQHVNGVSGKFYYPENMGSGGAFLDYDRDGWLDILLVNSSYWPGETPPGASPPTLALYHNNHNGTFSDVTAQAGLNLTLYGMGVAVGDYDNDGYDDLYVTGLGRSLLLHNETGNREQAKGKRQKAKGKREQNVPSSLHPLISSSPPPFFRDVTREAGVGNEGHWGTSAAWLDYDNDGRLDLFVCNYVQWSPEKEIVCRAGGQRIYCGPIVYLADTCRLFHNETGNREQGTGNRKPPHPSSLIPHPFFKDVTRSAGIYNTGGKALGVAVWDMDGDGYPEILVANDLTPNYLFQNLRNGTFREIGVEAGIAYPVDGKARSGMGIDVADIRNDGKCSLYISNFAHEPNSLFSQQRPFFFSDTASESGMGEPSLSLLGFGLFFFDYDNDGWKDAFVTNGHVQPDIARTEPTESHAQEPLLFHHRGDGNFEEVHRQVGGGLLKAMVGRGAVCGDYDNDGDLDILVTSNGGPPLLLRNDGGSRSHWLTLRLIGRKSNRDGIGAAVKVRVGSRILRDQARSGSSYLSAGDLRLHLGLGAAQQADEIEVRWPSGAIDRLHAVRANQILEITEGQAK